MAVDENGFLWLASKSGLVFFNGKRSLLFVGDTNLGRKLGERLLSGAEEKFTEKLRRIFEKHTFVLANIECVFTNSIEARQKQFVIKAKPELAHILADAGITHAVTANNHAYDYGYTAFNKHIQVLEKQGLRTVNDIVKFERHRPERIKIGKNEVLIFALNVCVDAIADSLVPFRDRFANFLLSIKNEKKLNSDVFILATLHFGTEYTESATQFQRKIASDVISAGADALVGHHPHVAQNVEFILNKPVIYSLGNFVFDQNRPETQQSYGFVLRFDEKQKPIFALKPFRIRHAVPEIMKDTENNVFLQKITKLSPDVIFTQKNEEWIIESRIEHFSLSFYKNIENYPISLADTCASLFSKNFSGVFCVRKLEKLNRYELSFDDAKTKEKARLGLQYPLYRFAVGDIDGDGEQNIFIGVIKSTKFDPLIKRRLFIYQIKNGRINPLWLGSRLLFPLCDFEVFKENGKYYVKTLEQKYNELYCISLYDYGTFGLKLIRITDENLSEIDAKKRFYGV
jgi:poly-gamma-glutamate synthesis protein (capsule biosynthesis protein)